MKLGNFLITKKDCIQIFLQGLTQPEATESSLWKALKNKAGKKYVFAA
jgi:hypothetical protein